MGRKVLLSIGATLYGAVVGILTISLLGAVASMFERNTSYASFEAALLTFTGVFLSGLIWMTVGACLFVLGPGFLLLLAYALTPRLRWLNQRAARLFPLAFAAVLYAPLFIFGYSHRPLSAAVLLVAMVVACSVSLRFLERRLAGGLTGRTMGPSQPTSSR